VELESLGAISPVPLDKHRILADHCHYPHTHELSWESNAASPSTQRALHSA
jgi:hypothetical protein